MYWNDEIVRFLGLFPHIRNDNHLKVHISFPHFLSEKTSFLFYLRKEVCNLYFLVRNLSFPPRLSNYINSGNGLTSTCNIKADKQLHSHLCTTTISIKEEICTIGEEPRCALSCASYTKFNLSSYQH